MKEWQKIARVSGMSNTKREVVDNEEHTISRLNPDLRFTTPLSLNEIKTKQLLQVNYGLNYTITDVLD